VEFVRDAGCGDVRIGIAVDEVEAAFEVGLTDEADGRIHGRKRPVEPNAHENLINGE
jgi:hypothetical protein